MVWTTYKEKLKRVSQRIVDVQKPIRILDAIKWDASVAAELKKGKFKVIPKVGPEYYEKNVLGYDPKKKIEELQEILVEIDATLGAEDSVGRLLKTMAQEYIDVVEMIQGRGTKKLWEYSRKLYGSPKDTFYDDKNTIYNAGQLLYSILSQINDSELGVSTFDTHDSKTTVDILKKRFKAYFTDASVDVRLADEILADASAGGDVVKIKDGSVFTTRDIDILEVHEGWVHIGTTQNGLLQPVAKWLAKGPPRCAATQEGLAVIMEIFTFRTYPKRARHINDRILGIDKAEDGANILELIEFYRTEGYTEDESISNAMRVFRGGVLEGGAPFTKDISYCRGFIENYNFIRTAVRAGKLHLIPFLFVGKIKTDDIPLLYQKYKEGIVEFPKYLPPQFKDLNGLAVWMGFSSFLNNIDLKKIQEHYNKLFEMHL